MKMGYFKGDWIQTMSRLKMLYLAIFHPSKYFVVLVKK